jgi:DNA-binding transcriptional ArsR family regulator
MLRIHLTVQDLLRTRFASQPAPLVEVGLAVAALQQHDPVFRTWRRSAQAALPGEARLLLQLIPPSATGPLFLDPVTTELDEGRDLVQATPADLVAAYLRQATAAAAPCLRSLAAGDREAWRDLDRALCLAYQHLIETAWPRLLSGYRAELAWRSRLIAELGIQAALSTLHPSISWAGTVLRIDASAELDVRPDGAGLTLLPSVLWNGRPMVTRHPDGSVVIVYPAVTPLPLVDEGTGDPLAGLLGHTRAAVLKLALAERTTTELARELSVSAATVSGHTKALRAAGLIVTVRAGKAVLHSVTPLGGRLLASATGPPGWR